MKTDDAWDFQVQRGRKQKKALVLPSYYLFGEKYFFT